MESAGEAGAKRRKAGVEGFINEEKNGRRKEKEPLDDAGHEEIKGRKR